MLAVKKSFLRQWSESALVLGASLRMRKSPVHRVKFLMMKPDRLGDLAIVAPYIQALCERYGPEQIALVVSEGNAPLARRIFPRCALIEVPFYLATSRWREWRPFIEKVSLYQAEYALLYQYFWYPPHIQALWRAISAGKKLWLREVSGLLQTNPADTRLLDGTALRLDGAALPPGLNAHGWASAELFRAATGESLTPSRVPAPSLKPTRSSPVENRIAFFPFSSAPIRDLPPEMIAGIVNHLARHHGLACTFVATADRQADLEQLSLSLSQSWTASEHLRPTIFVPPSFDDFYQTIFSSRFVVTTDTGPAHMAIIHDRPSVAILGGGQFRHCAPWSLSTRQIWVYHELPCFGCDWQCPYPKPYCITDIPLASIYGAIDEIARQI